MTSSVEVMVRLAALASDQWGLVTSAQARDAQVSSQQLKALADYGLLHRVRHGVYVAAGAPSSSLESLRAAWLATSPISAPQHRLVDPSVIISHRSAALIHDIGDMASDKFEFTTRSRRQTNSDEIKFYCKGFSRSDWVIVDGLPITTVRRTLADLSLVSIDGGHLASLINDALAANKITREETIEILNRVAKKFGYPGGGGEDFLGDLLNYQDRRHG